MLNSTSVALGWDKLPIYIIWSLEFLFIGIPNLLIALAIASYEALRDRKEYLVILGLSFADFIYVGSFFMAAVYRTTLLIIGQHSSMSLFWQCFKLPFSQGWILSMHLSPMMLVIVSLLDRFISVVAPTQYLSFGRKYAYRMLGCVYCYCIMFSFVVIVVAVTKRAQPVYMTAPCYVAEVMLAAQNELALYFLYCGPILGFVAVIFYVLVGTVYIHKKNQTVGDLHQGSNAQQMEKRRQHRLTKSLRISCLCTMTFWVIPISLTFTGELFNFPRLLMQILWLLPNLNPGCNILIYYKRQPELIEGVQALLGCKHKPPVLSLWKSSGKHTNRTSTVAAHQAAHKAAHQFAHQAAHQ